LPTSRKIAAKGIGVAYLEPGKRLLITLGYRHDEKPCPVKLHTIHLGKVGMKAGDFHALEACMSKATSKHRNIICQNCTWRAEMTSRWP
jgi:hypothetical protein